MRPARITVTVDYAPLAIAERFTLDVPLPMPGRDGARELARSIAEHIKTATGRRESDADQPPLIADDDMAGGTVLHGDLTSGGPVRGVRERFLDAELQHAFGILRRSVRKGEVLSRDDFLKIPGTNDRRLTNDRA
jgi:hypothetical protein